jgi:peptidyl-prolyl cis-trans isomerase SurA
MKKHFLYIIPLVSILLLIGCTRHHAETIVATIGNQTLTLEDYETTFARLNGGWERGENATTEELEDFLDLLVKFRMKIKDAYDSGLHTEPDIQEELEEYRKTLAAAFLIERELVEPALLEMYQRRTEELRASHILIRLPPNPEPTDTMLAYRRALDVIQKLDEGQSFEHLALQYSEDPGVQNNKGDLYYFSGGMMVKPFEDAVFGLEVGEYTREPARTMFGYHVIKLQDRRPVPGSIRVSHIMIFAQSGASPEDTLNALNRIREIYDTLQVGMDFQEAAYEFSEDRQSAERGGDLGMIQRRSLPPDFETVAFSLEPGVISDIVRTEYGYHIIKVTDTQPPATYEEMKDNLRRQYQQRYMQDDNNTFVAGLREKFSFERYEDNIETFTAAIDTQWFADTRAWHDSLNVSVVRLPLMAIAGNTITALQVSMQIQNIPEFTGRRLIPSQVRTMLNRVEEVLLIQKEAEDIEKSYPEFAGQIEEYRDGILIYYIEQKRVWENIDLSEERLREFYEEHKERYTFTDRVNICEIVVRTDSLAQDLYRKIIDGADMEELAAQHTVRAGMKRNRGVTGMIQADRDEMSKVGFSQEIGEVSKPFQSGNHFAIVKTLDRDHARIKTFEEARAQITGEYQDMMANKLEQEWVDNLRERYQVNLFKENLTKAFTSEGQ